MSAKCLGVAAYAFDEDGNSVVGELGELVDHRADAVDAGAVLGRRRRHDRAIGLPTSSTIPGVMRFGDWVRFFDNGSCRRHRAIGRHAEPRRSPPRDRRDLSRRRTAGRGRDSLVVHLEDPTGGPGELILFVRASPTARRANSTMTTAHDRSGRAARRAVAAARPRPDRRRERRCRGTSPARSSSCRSSRCCRATTGRHGACRARRWPIRPRARQRPRGDARRTLMRRASRSSAPV